MNPELKYHLQCLTRAVFYVTDEEDKFIVDLKSLLAKHESNTWVYNGAFGLQPIGNLVKDWSSRAHHVETSAATIHDALIQIYKDDPKDKENFYVITDPERWFKDEHVQRRLLNVLHQLHQEMRIVKMLIFVGPRRVIPEKLARYINVVQDTGLTDEEITNTVDHFAKHLKVATPPKDPVQMFKGFTSYEIEEAITQSVIATRKDANTAQQRRIDPAIITKYKRNQLKKTDLVQFVDNSNDSFDNIGGADKFKAWARETKACWTAEGQKYGLTPPRGVLLVGVYGCGKSICAKAMAKEWDLPIISFEMGKLRSSGVGDSEGNLYRALRLVETMAPCVMWIDEAEKSLAGSASSAQSDAGTTSRLLGILSTWAQESKVPVCIAMTANSLKTLPVEMVNRMPERFFFDLPNEEDRVDILKIHAKKAGQDVSTFSLADLAEKAKNLVGREMEQAIGAAMVKSFVAKKPGLDEAILSETLTRKPRILTTMTDDIKEILTWVGYDPEADDGIRARLASSNRSEQFKLMAGGSGEK